MGGDSRRPVVLFVDQDAWNPFLQLAAALRRRGGRPVCVQLEGSFWQATLGRIAYGATLRADRARGARRLRRLIDSGRVADVHVNELNFARLDGASPVGVLLGRARGSRPGNSLSLLDKLAVCERLETDGIPVPRFVRLAGEGTEALEQAAGLGFPLVVKQRISSGGNGILVATDGASLTSAISTLTTRAGAGSPVPPIFMQRHVVGEVVQYSALIGPNGIEQEVCVLARKGVESQFGPSVSIVFLEDHALRDLGRKVVDALECRGLVNLEFIRDASGALWHIDVNPRAFGNMATLSGYGVDLIGGYLSLLGLTGGTVSAREPLAATTRLEVYPASLLERRRALGVRHALRAAVRESRPYLRQFGARYVLSVALVVVQGRVRAARRRRSS